MTGAENTLLSVICVQFFFFDDFFLIEAKESQEKSKKASVHMFPSRVNLMTSEYQ